MDDAIERLLEIVGEDAPFLCSLATVSEDGGPAVRFVRAKADADLTLRVPTFASTQKVRQIQANARVHITCGDTDSDRPGTYFQIEGRAEITTAAPEREACWTPRLAEWFSGPDDANYVVVKIQPAVIEALPIGRSGKPSIWKLDVA